jgi:hypothetical protein
MRIKTDVHNCVGFIQDPKLLKEGIKAVYQKYVNDDVVSFIFGVYFLFSKLGTLYSFQCLLT